MGGWTKEAREYPEGLETKTQRRALVGQAVCQDRVRKMAVCKPEVMFLKITLLSAVVKQYNKYEK